MAFTIIRHNALNDQTATRDIPIAGNTLSIGRGPGNDLTLDDLHVALRHAVIEYVDERYIIKDLDTTGGTYVNNRTVRIRPLADNDRVHIGSYDLRIRLPSGDGPLRIEVTSQGGGDVTDGAATGSYLSRYRLADSVFTKGRLTVWLLVLVIGVPVVLLVLGNISVGKKTWRATTLLSPGDVTQAHKFIAHDCAKCHSDTWRAPSTTACTACHASPGHHGKQEFTPDCVSCHREHRSDHKALTSMGDQFCTQCHADLRVEAGHTTSYATHIRGFEDGHPEFSATLQGLHDPKAQPTRVKLSEKAALRDPTTIRLNHEVHLTPKKMQEKGYKVLTCTNCHKTDDQGAYMAPITYTEQCSECHRLEFDERVKGQNESIPNTVRHGKQPDVIQTDLKEYFTLRCLDRFTAAPASAPEGGDTTVDRRRPGVGAATPREPQTPTAATVVQCRDERVRDAEKRLYAGGKQSVCGQCHTLPEFAATGQLPSVVKAAIPERWFPHSEFNHQAHMRAKRTGEGMLSDSKKVCESCHRPDLAASKSTETSDILLPGLASCQECHSSAGGASQQCVTCHQYHEGGIRSARKPS